MRKYLSLSPRQYAHVLGCGLDAVYCDIREGGIITVPKRTLSVRSGACRNIVRAFERFVLETPTCSETDEVPLFPCCVSG